MHAYAVARDMRGAVACVEEMEADGIVPNEATFSVVISGYGKLGNVKYVSLPLLICRFCVLLFLVIFKEAAT